MAAITPHVLWVRRGAGTIAEAIANGWRGIIASHEHLVLSIFGSDGKPDEDVKAAVGPRFVQWVLDQCSQLSNEAWRYLTHPAGAPVWVNYQHEIGLCHTPAKTNAIFLAVTTWARPYTKDKLW